MSSLTWGNGSGVVSTASGTTTLGAAPRWLPGGTVSAMVVDDGTTVVSNVSVNGEPDRVMTDSELASARAMWADNESLHGPTPIYAVNADGTFGGMVTTLGEGQTQVHQPPPGDGYLFDGTNWVIAVDLPTLKSDLQNNVDRAAGAARAKYITIAAGQDATYIVKEQQAQAFIADPTMTPVPGYIQAEADATGMSPLDAANFINETAQQWGVLGPQIEMIRRKGNIDIGAATTVADVMTAYNTAITNLAAC